MLNEQYEKFRIKLIYTSISYYFDIIKMYYFVMYTVMYNCQVKHIPNIRPQKAARGTPNINEKTWYMISLKNLKIKFYFRFEWFYGYLYTSLLRCQMYFEE